MLADAALRFDVRLDSLRLLGDHQAYVYGALSQSGSPLVLRITHVSHRQLGWIHAELEFVLYLAANRMAVASPVSSRSGNLLETVGQVGEFVAATFEWVEGVFARDDQLGPDLFATLGETLGRMHGIASTYSPAPSSPTRPHWHELDNYDFARYIPSSERRVLARGEEIVDLLSKLPLPSAVYGLIHSDLHLGNVLVQGTALTCIDFDSAQYCWWGYDVAAILFFTARRLSEPRQQLPPLLQALLVGYQRAGCLDSLLLDKIDLFLSARELTKYVLYYKQGRTGSDNPARARRREACRRNLEIGSSFLGIDWKATVADCRRQLLDTT